MAKTDSTKVMWRVQVRNSRSEKWRTHGQYETRETARHVAAVYRAGMSGKRKTLIPPLGFGNTRVVRHIRGEKK